MALFLFLAAQACGGSRALGPSGPVEPEAGDGQEGPLSDQSDSDASSVSASAAPSTWVRSVGGNDRDSAVAVALTADGARLALVGQVLGRADLDPGPGTSIVGTAPEAAGAPGAFVLELDRAGTHSASGVIAGTGSAFARGVAYLDDASLVIAGDFSGTVDFDMGPGLAEGTSSDYFDAFVARYLPDRSLAWHRTFEGLRTDGATALVATANNTVTVVGTYERRIDLDPGEGALLQRSRGQLDTFVVRLDDSGSFVRGLTFGGSGDDMPTAAAAGPDGSVIVVGTFHGRVEFDPVTRTHRQRARGETDCYVTRLDELLAPEWVITFGARRTDSCDAVATWPDGSVAVAGFVEGPADLDPGEGEQLVEAERDARTLWIARVEADGTFGWARSILAPTPQADWPWTSRPTAPSCSSANIAAPWISILNRAACRAPHRNVVKSSSRPTT